jgi:hypothetical protein
MSGNNIKIAGQKNALQVVSKLKFFDKSRADEPPARKAARRIAPPANYLQIKKRPRRHAGGNYFY